MSKDIKEMIGHRWRSRQFKSIPLRINNDAFNQNKIYSEFDIDCLKRVVAQEEGDSLYETARRLGRQTSAVFFKMKSLGLIKTHGYGTTLLTSYLSKFQDVPVFNLQMAIDEFLRDEVGYDVGVSETTHKDNPLLSSESVVVGVPISRLPPQWWGTWNYNPNNSISGGNTNNINKTGESKMTTRRTVTVNLYDDSKGIKDEVANVYSTDEVTSETSSERIIQQLLFNESHEISQAISDHNEYRVEQVDLDILQRTGIHVTLRPLEFKDLRWEIK